MKSPVFFFFVYPFTTLVLLTGYGVADSPALGTRRNRFLREPVVRFEQCVLVFYYNEISF